MKCGGLVERPARRFLCCATKCATRRQDAGRRIPAGFGYDRAMSQLDPFHLAFPVHDLDQARAFYGGLLGCPEGRSADSWIDFDLLGHQIVAHLDPAMQPRPHYNPVDGHDVPVPHFGVVLDWERWQDLANRLAKAGVTFAIAPTIRFKGQVGEQATMFFFDPSGNALEFKAFRDRSLLFAR